MQPAKILILLFAFGGVVGLKASQIKTSTQHTVEPSPVLGEATSREPIFFTVNIPARFTSDITAPNILYSLQAGRGVSISQGQSPTISVDLQAGSGIALDGSVITNTGIRSLSAGDGISVDGNKITNTGILSLSAGDGISIDGNRITNTRTPDYSLSGWSGSGSNIFLTTETNKVGIGTTTPSTTLHVVGSTTLSSLITTGSAVFQSTVGISGLLTANGIDNGSDGISNAGPVTGATGLTSSGTITFSGLNTGIVHSNASGILSSSAVNLASSDVTGSLPASSGGTGQTTYNIGDILYASSPTTLSRLGIGAEGQALKVSSGALVWGTVTGSGGTCDTCIINNPGSTQMITPSLGSATGLVVKQASGGTADIFKVTDYAGTTAYLTVDATGNVLLGTGQTTAGVLTISPANTDPLSISPVSEGDNPFTGTITSSDLTGNRTWTLPDGSGIICTTSGNCTGTSSSLGGNGTANYLAKWGDTYALTNSLLFDSGSAVGINDATPTTTLDVTGTANVTGNTTVGGTLGVTGATTLSSLVASGGVTFQSTLGVTGNSTIGGTLGITGGTTLTTLNASGNTTVGGTLGVTGATTLSSLVASGGVTFQSTLGVTGETTLSTLTTSGNATFDTNTLFIDSAGNEVGIGTTSPGSTLDIKGTLRLSGATSGFVGFAPAAAAGSTTYTLPTSDGMNGQVLTTDGSGVLSWTAKSTAFSGSGSSTVLSTTGGSAGYPISSSAYYQASHAEAFDGFTDIDAGIDITRGGWVNNGGTSGYIGYVFDSPVVITKYTVYPQYVSGNVARNPKNWTFEGSTNGTDWTVLDTQNNHTSWTLGTGKKFSIANTTEYTHYRLNISVNNGDSYTAVNELMLFTSVNNSPWSLDGTSLYYDAGNVGLGTSSPGSALDVKGTLRLSGATSGYVGFTPAAEAGSTTYTLPSSDGTNGQVLTTNGSGVLTWSTITGGTSITASTNDVTSSRAIDTIYQNTTGKPLVVNVYVSKGSTSTAVAYTGASSPPTTQVSTISAGAGWGLTLSFVVQADHYYKVANLDGTATLQKWIEWQLDGSGTAGWAFTGADTYRATGNVGIGTASPGQALDVVGNIKSSALTTGAVYSNNGVLTNTDPSDANLKENILVLQDGTLQKVLGLKPVSYNWKSSGDGALGFIAQEVAEVFPELVGTNQDGTLGLYTTQFIPVLTKALQEQQLQINQLTSATVSASLTSLTDQLDTHESVLSNLQNAMKSLKEEVNTLIGKVGELFAKKTHTEELCIGTADDPENGIKADETCITKDQLDELIKLLPSTSPSSLATPSATPLVTPSPDSSPSPTPNNEIPLVSTGSAQ